MRVRRNRFEGAWKGLCCLAFAAHLPSAAPAVPELLTAKDFSGFMRGDGYAWSSNPLNPHHIPPEPGRFRISTDQEDVWLEWESGAVLTSSRNLQEPWKDLFAAFSPHRITPSGSGSIGTTPGQDFFRLRQRRAIHSGVDTGAPQQGFGFTGLPGVADAPDTHWTNTPYDADTCGWIIRQEQTGYQNVPEENPDYVRVLMRSFHDFAALGINWGEGQYGNWEDNVVHQNDGWFHFRVRKPAGPGSIPKDYLLDFEIDWDNDYVFQPAGSQLNAWWLTGYAWDWEEHMQPDGETRHIYRPMYRILDAAGRPGPWQHITEANTVPDATHRFTDVHSVERSYRCRYKLEILAATEWSEVEVAQNLPYTLADRKKFLHHIQETYPPQHADLCIRKRHLAFGGLQNATPHPDEDIEKHELYAIEIFRKVPGTIATPDLPNDKILIVLAGLDYEPAGNWAAEGAALEILDKWDEGGQMFKDAGSYVIIPIGDVDGYEWPATHTTPYGNGYGDNMIHRGYIFMEGEVPDTALDPEMRKLREYIQDLDADGLDGAGGDIVALLDLQDDICPHPGRWLIPSGPDPDWRPYPPIYGLIHYFEPEYLSRAEEFIVNLRQPFNSTYTSSYVHNHNVKEGWWKRQGLLGQFGVPLFITFEFDAAVLYSWLPGLPTWVSGGFSPVRIPGPGGGGAFWAHGFIDQVGQAIAGDPAWVFKQFGRDIIDAAREELFPSP